ncbi:MULTISPECIES: cell division protein ZapE [Rhodovulum]|uniref:Cell division protein ZapE n=2 Tax=Rhodovulum TaxID=34008 RepID=A0A8E2VL10_9RHOB|nr:MULTISPECIES: cell division protein ZapE [Rhodovulum]PTW50402.1 cell division protein ZapE [Rhodovulum kholense]RAP40782.1 cell division protein ZapE [Rhodovulum viride]
MSETLKDLYDARAAEGHLRPDPAQIAALAPLDRIREALENPPPAPRGGFFRKAPPPDPVRGLYLWGGVGRGKSMLMDLFFGAVAIEGKRRVHFHAFMQEVHRGLHAARATGADDALRPVAAGIADGLKLLCFDEMQIVDITDAMIVGRLFELLFAAGVTVVTTSNRVPGDLYKDGLQRERFLPFIRMLEERLEVMELGSATDYRQNRLTGEEVYFTPSDRAARARMAAIWEHFTHGEGGPLVLRVQGRQVELPFFHNGVARATFWDLCAKPLGPADYLAMAQAVRVLILEDIPRLSSENYNEARRFVTLIDALYEGKVRLIASAAAEPEMLYLEGEGTFEFERTASRLREMQGADWARG